MKKSCKFFRVNANKKTLLSLLIAVCCIITLKTYCVAGEEADPADFAVNLEMYNSNRNETTNTISPKIKLTNLGDNPINFMDLKIRYFYTVDEEKNQVFWCDWSDAGSSNVYATFVKMPVEMVGADHYVQIGFNDEAGELTPGASIELHIRITKEDWSNYIQTNDYSFSGTNNKYQNWDKVAVYFDDNLIYGTEPAEAAPVMPQITSVRLEVSNASEKDRTNTLYPRYILYNTGNTPINLEDVRIRYYYTIDGEKEQNYWCDWSSAGTNNVTGKFVKLADPMGNADYYCETSFKTGAGVLKPGNSIEIQSRIAKVDWSDYNQANDYSFSGEKKYIVFDKASVFVGNDLLWGDNNLLEKPKEIITASFENSIELLWREVEGAIFYEIENGNQIIGCVNDNRFIHNGLDAGTVYNYRIRAVSSKVTGNWSDTITAITLSAPPRSIRSISSEEEITVEWDSSKGAVMYDIELDGVFIGNVTSPFTRDGFTCGTEHTYRIRANNQGGTGNWSDEFRIWTLPGLVEDIELTATETEITAVWNVVKGASGYDIEISGMILDADTIPFIVRGMQPGQEYCLRVRAKNSSGAGKWSDEIRIWTLPDIPAGITYNATETQIELMWDGVTGATGYDIEVDGQLIENIENHYLHMNLDDGTLHRYRVRAKNPSGTGKWSSEYQIWTLPPAVEGIHTFATQDVVAVSWNDTRGASSYHIEFDGQVYESEAPSFSMIQLLPGTEHFFRIRAVNGSGAGQWSDIISYWTIPGAVSYLTGAATASEIVITWDAVDGASGYDIEVDGQVIEDQTSPYNHVQLLPGTRHIYRVRAKNPSGSGIWSESLIVWTIPDKVHGLILMPQETEIFVEWEPVNGAKGYDLEVNDVVIYDAELPYFHTELLPGTYYEYRVRAKNSSGAGEWSDPVGIRTIPGIVRHINSQADENSISIEWQYVEGADSYDIEFDGIISENVTSPFICEELDPGTDHRFRIRAVNSSGIGRWSDEVTVRTIPGVPVGIEMAATETSITIRWDDVTGADSYDLEIDGIVIRDVFSPYVCTELQPGNPYRFRVRAKNSSGEGKWSYEYSILTLPGIVSHVDASATQYGISLVWEQVKGSEGYDISINGTIIENVDSPYAFTDLTQGTMYTFSIRPFNTSGKGKWNNEFIVWTLPDIPQNINATATSSSISLQWDSTTGASNYEIEILGTPVKTSVPAYTHYGLNPNTQYAYRVRALNSSGAGEWSSIIAKTTLPGTPNAISSYSSENSIRIEWNRVAGATEYDVEVDGEIITGIFEPSFEHIDLLPDTVHVYRVRSKNEEGTGDWSGQVFAATLMAAPESLTADASTDRIVICWNTVNNASGYDIEVDGKILDNGIQTSYVHDGLDANTEHIYRVRARRGDFEGSWSSYIYCYTMCNAPENITATVSSTDVNIKWDMIAGAAGYDVEFDGEIVDNGLSGAYTRSGLVPLSSHQIRVRARIGSRPGAWSEHIKVVTLPDTPTGILTIRKCDQIHIRWDHVQGGEEYELSFDGNIVCGGISNEYTQTGLEPDTVHYFRVRAKSGVLVGDWSEIYTCKTLIGTPANVNISAESRRIIISWDEVAGAISYDIEMDGDIVEKHENLYFIHSGLEPKTSHQYRIRARTDSEQGEWSELLTAVTTIGVPEGIEINATTTEITIKWGKVEGAESYDLEVDGEIISYIKSLSYTHGGLKPNTQHTYRIRSRDDISVSEWCDLIEYNTVPEVTISLKKDNTFNFVIVVPPFPVGSERTVVVEYDPEEINVFDLCAVTTEPETEVGPVKGTNITVVEFLPGKIIYKISGSGSTTVNIIKFLSITNGNSKVTYTVK